MKVAFGKLDPNEHGVLPVLVVIQNDTERGRPAERMKVEYLGPEQRARGSHAGERRPLPAPTATAERDPGPAGKVKVLQAEEESAGCLGDRGPRVRGANAAAGQAASGFFYFQTPLQPRRHHLRERHGATRGRARRFSTSKFRCNERSLITASRQQSRWRRTVTFSSSKC